MKIRIESPDFKASPSLKSFITDKVGKLERFYKDIQEVEVTLIQEAKKTKDVIVCTLNIRVPGKDEYVKANSEIFEDAILKSIDAGKRRLQTRKTQLALAKKKASPNRTKTTVKATATTAKNKKKSDNA